MIKVDKNTSKKRLMKAYLLRQKGLTYQEIGEQIPSLTPHRSPDGHVSRERARQMVVKAERMIKEEA